MNASSEDNNGDQANAPVTHAPIDPLSGESSQASLAVSRVVAVCPICKAALSVRRVYLGTPVRCKQCGQVFTVPADVVAPPEPARGGTAAHAPGQAPQDEVKPGSKRAGIGAQTILDQLAKLVAQQETLRLEYDQLQAERDELRADRDRLKLHEADLGAVSAERDALATKLAEVSSELNVARNEVLRLNSPDLTPPDGPSALAPQLEAARVLTEQLQWKLAEADYRCRLMAETLDQLGVSVDVKTPAQANLGTTR